MDIQVQASLVNKQSLVPLHIQLASLIRQQVLEKKFAPGDRLLSERELCETHGVSRITVRHAIRTLVNEGLVVSSAGKGNYVAHSPLNEELQPLSSFTQDLERRGMRASSQVLEARIISADAEWSDRLAIPRGADVVFLKRLRLANNLPISVQTTHLPHHLCPDLLAHDFSEHSLYEILSNNYLLKLARSTTIIEAALAQPEEAQLLLLKRPSAVLISLQTTYVDIGAVIEVTRSIFHAERYKLHAHT